MPDGFLLLAFALTLVANAVLIAIALRAMRPGGALSDQPAIPRERSGQGPAHGGASAPVRGDGDPSHSTTRNDPQPSDLGHPGTERDVVAEDAIVATSADPPEVEGGEPSPAAPSTTKRRSRKSPAKVAHPDDATPVAPASRSRARKTPSSTGNGRRRRFSLPPLDDDSEKVSRSIESFLSSGESAGDAGAPGQEPDSDPPPTTVALVAITDAAPPPGAGNGHLPPAQPTARESTDAGRAHDEDGRRQSDAGDDAQADGATDAAVAALEHSLRSAARGTDQVDAQEAGRFRVVLAAAGELAARAYLRRVRASVDPILEDLDPPRRLAVATATVLGDPLDQADELAERRLTAAIQADGREHRAPEEDRVEKPRAAGD